MIKLGDKVKDKLSGMVGTAIARTDWLYGCVRFMVQPDGLHEGRPIEAQGFDEAQLEVVVAKPLMDQPESEERPGGPRPDPTRPASPSRH